MAEQILSEIGTDVGNQFPSAAHLCSWAALVPGHNESAGKRKSAKGKKGNKYLKSALTEAYYLLTRKEMYVDLGVDYFDKQKQQAIVRNSVRRLENLGFNVSISEVS